MEYIEINTAIRNHPQLFKLAELLGISVHGAMGLVAALWLLALDIAPDGDLSKFETAYIARAIEWDGDAEQLFFALKSSGFLDENNVICDRHKYSGEMLYRPGE